MDSIRDSYILKHSQTSEVAIFLAKVSWLGKWECPCWGPPKNLCTTDSIKRINRNPENGFLLTWFVNSIQNTTLTHSDQKLCKWILQGLWDHSKGGGPLQALPHLPQHVKEDSGQEDASAKAQHYSWDNIGGVDERYNMLYISNEISLGPGRPYFVFVPVKMRARLSISLLPRYLQKQPSYPY